MFDESSITSTQSDNPRRGERGPPFLGRFGPREEEELLLLGPIKVPRDLARARQGPGDSKNAKCQIFFWLAAGLIELGFANRKQALPRVWLQCENNCIFRCVLGHTARSFAKLGARISECGSPGRFIRIQVRHKTVWPLLGAW